MFKYWTQVKVDDINHMNVWTTCLPKISDQRKELSVVSLVLTRRRKRKCKLESSYDGFDDSKSAKHGTKEKIWSLASACVYASVEVIFKVKKELLCLRNVCACTWAYAVGKPGFREESTEW